MEQTPLPRLRKVCAAPATIEQREGMPVLEHHARDAAVFRVRGRSFAWYLDNHHGDGRVAVWCKTQPERRDALVAEDPARFFVPPYLGHRGWVGLRLDVEVDWDGLTSSRRATGWPRRNGAGLFSTRHRVRTLATERRSSAGLSTIDLTRAKR